MSGLGYDDKFQGMAQRYDQGKSRVELIDPDFIFGLGSVMAMGAEKYSANNWKASLNTAKHDDFVLGCRGSLMRHAMKMARGEELDDESGLHHSFHVAANAMFIAYYDENKDVSGV